jgi:hypothetical protein
VRARSAGGGKVTLTLHLTARGRSKLRRAHHAKLTLKVHVVETNRTLSRTLSMR